VDESIFNLTQLRADLKSGKASYLGTSNFQGKTVFRIRNTNGDILLLDAQYMPVNVIDAEDVSTGTPVFTTLQLYRPAKCREICGI
jgi:hypothetical protein